MYQRQVGFGEAVQSAFSKYCCFSGRASRSEYWWFALFNFIVGAVFSIGALIFAGDSGSGTNLFTILSYIYSLAVFLPGLGLSVRRLHDIGKGGGWIFIGFIPIVGTILLLVWFCQGSEPGENRFGEVPNLIDN